MKNCRTRLFVFHDARWTLIFLLLEIVLVEFSHSRLESYVYRHRLNVKNRRVHSFVFKTSFFGDRAVAFEKIVFVEFGLLCRSCFL